MKIHLIVANSGSGFNPVPVEVIPSRSEEMSPGLSQAIAAKWNDKAENGMNGPLSHFVDVAVYLNDGDLLKAMYPSRPELDGDIVS